MFDEIRRPPRPARIAFLYVVYAVFALPWGVGILASVAHVRNAVVYGGYDFATVSSADLFLLAMYLTWQAFITTRSVEVIRTREHEDELSRVLVIGVIFSTILGIVGTGITGLL
jgi:hypothetical protein